LSAYMNENTGITVDGWTIKKACEHGIYIDGAGGGITLRNLTISNPWHTGIKIASRTGGTWLKDVNLFEVVVSKGEEPDNILDAWRSGIWLEGCYGGSIRNLDVSGPFGSGLKLTSVVLFTIVNPQVSGCVNHG